MILHTKKNENYSVIDNRFLRNEKLSWKAKGLLAYLCSLPNDWKIHGREISKHSAGGKAVVYAGLKELQKEGYVRKKQKKDEKNRMAGIEYIVYEHPELADFPYPEKWDTGKPDTENRDILSTNLPSTKLLNTDEELPTVGTVSPHQQVMHRFSESFEKHTGEKPIMNGRHGKDVKTWLKCFTLEKVLQGIDNFFFSESMKNKNFPWPLMASNFAGFIAGPDKAYTGRPTQRAHDTAKSAVPENSVTARIFKKYEEDKKCMAEGTTK